ncbi:HAD-superfamily hydrolase [Planococcus antarcticus DSM 14505]|uniref:HAD-superfamily hydrolase n=1 Tax=Planococcus antarcticus DSM 14505 TaxID=1185653 RepID=A0A1C7DCH9_9BACL|nr:HAD family hydrolase [Planococcus antarcticus]ANU09154.1 L-2-haloalkanoic acid dehalogenase [Planococcus antarcticus DSM 14505]EIM08506.1 HAD-superfamily hydrolase [Planococcus antarcticus DSM 14505]
MIKAIIFDLDGTLLDRDSSLFSFVDDQYNRLARHVQHIPKDLFIKRFIELDAKGYVWKDRVYQQLIKELGIRGIEWQTMLADYVANFKNHCLPFPDLTVMLENLSQQSFRLGMITNGRGQFQLDSILALEIKDYFEEILISEWEGMAKPDAAIFHKALASLGVSASEAIYIGDHPKNDIQAAKLIGMKTIWKKDGHWSCLDADGEIDGLKEIAEWVERLNTEKEMFEKEKGR